MWHHLKRDPVVLGVFGAAAVVTTVALWQNTTAEHLCTKIVAVFLIELGTMLGLLLFVGTGVLVSLVFLRDKTFLTEHTLEITEAGLTEVTAYGTQTCNWEAVGRIGITPRRLFVYISRSSAHVIPRESVSSDADWDNLQGTLKRHATSPHPTSASSR